MDFYQPQLNSLNRGNNYFAHLIKATMKKNNKLNWITGILLLTFVSSCKKKDAPITTPAHYIKQSETVSIPSAITLPANEPNGNATVISLFAKGVQKYKSRQKANAGLGCMNGIYLVRKQICTTKATALLVCMA